MKVRELLTSWTFDIDNAPLNKMDKKIDSVKSNATSFGTRMRSVSDGMVSTGLKLTAFVTLPILGLGAAMIKAASDAEESEAKFATVFQDVGKEAESVAKNLRNNFGLSSNAAKELLGNTGDLLTGFGFTGKAALDLAKGVNELAVDLASFTNFSGGAEGASAALTKALLGERESVKALGISILESDVKAKVLALRASGRLTNESERQAKAIATLEIALSQSKNAIGDFARTQEGLANATRIMRARIDDMLVAFGKLLIPIALKTVAVITKLSLKFESLSEDTKEWVLIAFGIVAVLPPIILLVGLLAGGILSLAAAFTVLKTIMLAVRAASLATLLVWAIIPIIYAAIGVGILLLLEDFWKFATGGKSAIGELITKFTGAKVDVEAIGETISGALSKVLGWFVKLGQIELAVFDLVVKSVTKGFADIEALVNGGDSALGNWLDTFGGFGTFIKDDIKATVELVKDLIALFGDLTTAAGEFLGGKLFDLLNDTPEEAAQKKRDEELGINALGFVSFLGDKVDKLFEASSPEPQKAPINPTKLPINIAELPINAANQALNPLPTATSNNANTQNNASQSQTVNTSINITVPDGTPEKQKEEIAEIIKVELDGALNKSNREAINELAGVT